jgi:hypothetical protein
MKLEFKQFGKIDLTATPAKPKFAGGPGFLRTLAGFFRR